MSQLEMRSIGVLIGVGTFIILAIYCWSYLSAAAY
jgi:hypothetical protein